MARLAETENFPWDEDKIRSRDPEERVSYFKGLIKRLRDVYSKTALVVNQNEKLRYIPQNAKPTPEQGQLLVWKDTDAGAGQSTHYLLFNDSGTVISWDSVEKA